MLAYPKFWEYVGGLSAKWGCSEWVTLGYRSSTQPIDDIIISSKTEHEIECTAFASVEESICNFQMIGGFHVERLGTDLTG